MQDLGLEGEKAVRMRRKSRSRKMRYDRVSGVVKLVGRRIDPAGQPAI
jgi:hypothetical protein